MYNCENPLKVHLINVLMAISLNRIALPLGSKPVKSPEIQNFAQSYVTAVFSEVTWNAELWDPIKNFRRDDFLPTWPYVNLSATGKQEHRGNIQRVGASHHWIQYYTWMPIAPVSFWTYIAMSSKGCKLKDHYCISKKMTNDNVHLHCIILPRQPIWAFCKRPRWTLSCLQSFTDLCPGNIDLFMYWT